MFFLFDQRYTRHGLLPNLFPFPCQFNAPFLHTASSEKYPFPRQRFIVGQGAGSTFLDFPAQFDSYRIKSILETL